MSAAVWSVWSWDANNRQWLEVAEGTKTEMSMALARKEAAAARLMPEARFTMTPQAKPPTAAPES